MAAKKSKIPKSKLSLSGNALASVAAVLSSPKERSDQEKAYDAMVMAAVIKKSHRQRRASKEVLKHKGQRLYVVTTIASSVRYGGTRTVIVCSTFAKAKQIVEKNVGDIFECSYMLAVIEATVADWLYGGCLDEQYWYVWEGSTAMRRGKGEGGYVPIERPKEYANTMNIGIG